jgi:hypothetical protein
MSYIKGLIPADKVPEFLQFISADGYDTRPGGSTWELGQVLLDGRWTAITTSSKGVVGLPAGLAGYVKGFMRNRQEPEGITDTERLNFMLDKCRKVVVEIEGWGSEGRHFAVYVEEGFMSDKTYQAVRLTQEELDGASEQGRQIKREAIDLAINETKV